jgi:hypothetical protein
MLATIWQATKGYRLRPWQSPYLRWRMETYLGRPAEGITFREFWSLSWRLRRDLRRFLHWADRMQP